MEIKRWGRVWLLALLIALCFLAAWEGLWRSRGFRPSVQDRWGLWATLRSKASDRGDKAAVLIGASRIQTGLHPKTFSQVTGWTPIMLAIDGSNPIPVLKDLADDPEVTGTVICSLIPMWLGEDSEDMGRSKRWIREYHNRKWSKRIETELTVFLQQHLVFRYKGLHPDEILEDIKDGQWPRKPYGAMRADRFRPLDFSMTDIKRIRQGRIERERQFHENANPLPAERFLDKVRKIDGMVRKIQKRGGRVIFVRFPSTGVVRRLESRTWPREKYWDVLTANTRAVSIHFEDYPSMSRFDCPDGSHLDRSDTEAFTRSLCIAIGTTLKAQQRDDLK